MVDLIASQLGGMTRAAARREALWIFSTMIGAVVMARVVTDPEVSDSILARRVSTSLDRRDAES